MERLQAARRDFELARSRFVPHADHLVPDMVLQGYLIEIDESVRAAEILLANHWAHRAFPNVRTAFEAAQLLLLLVTDADYDLAGARAWLYYQRKDAKYASMHRPHVTLGADAPSPDEWFRGGVDQVAATWEAFSPGKGETVRRALTLLEVQPRRPDNWAGVPVAHELEHRFNALAQKQGGPLRSDIAATHSAGYAAFTRESHPRTRFKPSEVRGTPHQPIQFTFPDPSPSESIEPIVVGAAGALQYAVLAVTIRNSLT